MGYHSEQMINDMSSPQLSGLDKFVCEDCVLDKALVELVSENLISKTCSYCSEESDEQLIAAKYDIVMERIYDSIFQYYQDAQETDMPWVEGGWLVEDSNIYEVFGEFDPGWSVDFVEDLIKSGDPNWYLVEHVMNDWAIEDINTTLMYGWQSFKDQVLTKTRYLFLSEPPDEHSVGRPDYIPIASMLDALGATCIQEGLVKSIQAGTEFYRVRHSPGGDSYTSFSEMGVPPIGVATAGRMNPAGISYLYLAYSSETAEKEVLEWSKRWHLAKFRLREDIIVIDFSSLPEIPSIFEPQQYESKQKRTFLRRFTSDLIEPVSKDGKEHVDYVPTQIVSEYFRYKFRDEKNRSISGIKYPSVKNQGGINLAIFSSSNDELEVIFELVETIEKSL